ncbi:hypothetical protein [Tenggerimyces flavus]|uniref:Uncharacterized protein n=1 Tax=Tenggerimyces flavus TaxID=1708749 RepID=A0ABV7YFE7_9ACTN|nr:hypothetical protein [Tenggerimyces flavus]MBM7789161.1 hypothetical protein [Tenggerimyces flavus]
MSTSEQDEREYVAKVRSAPVEGLVSELLFQLLSAAQIKLGRRDARLLIDLAGVVTDHARGHVPADFAKQVDESLGQLRLAQVSAEREVAQRAEPEPNDLASVPTPPSPAPASAPAPAPASKLWVPGR